MVLFLVLVLGLVLRKPVLTIADAQKKAARGEAVELIGEWGLPVYHHHEVLTGPDTKVFLDQEGTMAVSAQKLGMVELIPDPMQDRYSFRVMVRQDIWTLDFSRAGIYCLHHARETDRGQEHSFVELGVAEDDVEQKKTNKDREGAGGRQGRRLTSVAANFRLALEDSVFLRQRVIGQAAFETDEPPAGEGEPCRELRVEVTPEEIRCWHGSTKKVGAALECTFLEVRHRSGSLLSNLFPTTTNRRGISDASSCVPDALRSSGPGQRLGNHSGDDDCRQPEYGHLVRATWFRNDGTHRFRVGHRDGGSGHHDRDGGWYRR